MEENAQVQETVAVQKRGFNPAPVIGIVAFVVIVGYSMAMFGNRSSGSQPKSAVQGAQTTVQEKTFRVEGGNFYFKPNELRVKKGDKVKITFTNSGGLHDFVLDEFHVKTSRIKGGDIASVTFIADKTGTFEYYCSVGAHRQMGMKGNIIVE